MVDWGKIAYGFYRAATRFASPLIHAHIRWRILCGLDHPTRWPERLGRPSSPRTIGPLLWFHAVSLGHLYRKKYRDLFRFFLNFIKRSMFFGFNLKFSGEGLAAIPVIKHCIKLKPHLTVLMTMSTTTSAL